MCLASLNLQEIDPVNDGPAIADHLEDTAKLFTPDQAVHAARMLIAAHIIRGLLDKVPA